MACLLQDPLYLPSNSELQVSIWRLTNQRQVWYEWYAEAFMPLPGSSSIPQSPRERRATLQVPIIKQLVDGGPVMDALDAIADSEDGDGRQGSASANEGDRVGLVKIGQTSLHNPRGRSSWIGL